MKFAITFQQRYQREDHPVIPEVTEKSYMVVDAQDERSAREALRDLIENDYAFIYRLDDAFKKDIRTYDLHRLPYEVRNGDLVIVHNHQSRGRKPLGQCQGCDVFHAKALKEVDDGEDSSRDVPQV